ncbi:TlpA family protein disulfide reductase [Rhizobium sp. ICMP 5592]|nr:TlpA family protein disulfide reductase [Rhizobium sp. ICMP 5592]
MLPGNARSTASRWPPVFETARSQFTIVEPREKVPPLRLKDLDNREVVIKPKLGRVTLVNLWATWCAACRIDLPLMGKLERGGVAGLDVIAICTDGNDVNKVKNYLQDIGEPNLNCFTDPYGSATDVRDPSASKFKVYGMPITYLIGKTGYIEGFITGAADWLSPAGIRTVRFYQDGPGN